MVFLNYTCTYAVRYVNLAGLLWPPVWSIWHSISEIPFVRTQKFLKEFLESVRWPKSAQNYIFYSNSCFIWTLKEKHYEVLHGTIPSLKVHQPVIPDSGLLLINLDIIYTEQPQTCGRGGTNPTRECQIPYATSPACSPHPLPHVFLLSSLTVRALELFA